MRVSYSPAAIADLDQIVVYGADRWGFEAAECYFLGLRERLESLVDHPLRYPLAPEIRADLRSLTHRRHRIFYLVEPDRIVIARVLHQQSDVSITSFDRDGEG